MDSNRRLREEFARTCFETLLQFSFLGPKGNPKLFLQNPSPGNLMQVPESNGHVASHSHHDKESRQETLLPSSFVTIKGLDANQHHPHQTMEFGKNGMTPLQVTATCFSPEVGLVNRLAVTSLLKRFHEVIVKFVEDEKLSGKCPLARHRVSEMSFVLKALSTLICSLKKAPVDSIEEVVWLQLINLYPHLVDCTTSSNFSVMQVNRSLQEVLREYKDLLQPPSSLSFSSRRGSSI